MVNREAGTWETPLVGGERLIFNNSFRNVKAGNSYELNGHYPVNLINPVNPGSDNYAYFVIWN